MTWGALLGGELVVGAWGVLQMDGHEHINNPAHLRNLYMYLPQVVSSVLLLISHFYADAILPQRLITTVINLGHIYLVQPQNERARNENTITWVIYYYNSVQPAVCMCMYYSAACK